MENMKIKDEELDLLGVAALPTRPTAAKAFGGKGYTAAEMKAAFDRLPRLIAERHNALVAAAAQTGEGSLAAAMPTGLTEGHTLAQLFEDLASGAFAAYATVHGDTLADVIAELKSDVAALKARS